MEISGEILYMNPKTDAMFSLILYKNETCDLFYDTGIDSKDFNPGVLMDGLPAVKTMLALFELGYEMVDVV